MTVLDINFSQNSSSLFCISADQQIVKIDMSILEEVFTFTFKNANKLINNANLQLIDEEKVIVSISKTIHLFNTLTKVVYFKLYLN